VGYGVNTSFRSLLGSQGVSSSNTYGAINTSRTLFFHDETQLFCTSYKIISHYEYWIRKHQLVGTNVIAKESESRKGRH